MKSRAVRKYLQNYAEPEVALLPDDHSIGQHYQHVLVIPVCDEPKDFLTRVIADAEVTAPLLVILVLNCPDVASSDAAQSRIQNSTRAVWDSLLASTRIRWRAENDAAALTRYRDTPCIDLLLLDRCSDTRCVPHRQGVGLARKIGNDIALALVARGLVGNPWLYNTDADVKLPGDYFSATPNPAASAGLYTFEHHAQSPGLDLAMALYELSLHYYVLGLRWAGSRYANHSIGSIITINAQHYAEIRGFPKRSGAEDFYLLNKLAKAGLVTGMPGAPILINGRASERVPFGTGPALSKISRLANPIEEFTFYAPGTFTALRQWLESVAHLWEHREEIATVGLTPVMLRALQEAGTRQPTLDAVIAGLESLGLATALEHALAHSQQEATFIQHIHTWFDALRTLQFIHYLRDTALPSMPYRDSVARASFMLNDVPEQDTAWQQAHVLSEKISSWNKQRR